MGFTSVDRFGQGELRVMDPAEKGMNCFGRPVTGAGTGGDLVLADLECLKVAFRDNQSEPDPGEEFAECEHEGKCQGFEKPFSAG